MQELSSAAEISAYRGIVAGFVDGRVQLGEIEAAGSSSRARGAFLFDGDALGVETSQSRGSCEVSDLEVSGDCDSDAS